MERWQRIIELLIALAMTVGLTLGWSEAVAARKERDAANAQAGQAIQQYQQLSQYVQQIQAAQRQSTKP